MSNYHELLGVDETASPAEIKYAWRKKCMENHPDKGGDPDTFIQLTHAYKMLTDSSYLETQRQRQRPTNHDLEFRVQFNVSFEEAFFGTKILIHYNQIEMKSGLKPVAAAEQTLTPITIEFDLPPGSCGGFRKSFKNKGCKLGSLVGAATVSVSCENHPRYSIRGHNVVAKEHVPLESMLKGDVIEVETLYGVKALKIPPGSPPGTELKIPNCGVNAGGYQICTLEPIFPTVKEMQQSETWKRLDIRWSETEDLEKKDEDFLQLFNTLTKDFS